MINRLAIVLFIAFAVSAGACLLLYKAWGRGSGRATAEPAQQLLVAARELHPGTLLHDGDFHMVAWHGARPEHALSDPAQLVNRGVMATVLAGEPLVEERLAPQGAGAGLAATIPVGMRAVAVRVNDVVGVSGFATPGMKVDVLVLGVPPGAPPTTGTQARTLLQDLMVLSAGQEIQKSSDGKPLPVQVVNLLVTPRQAVLLSLAGNDARIQLVLRNPVDGGQEKVEGSALSEIFGGGETRHPTRARVARRPAAPAEIAPKVAEVEFLHGKKRDVVRFGPAPASARISSAPVLDKLELLAAKGGRG